MSETMDIPVNVIRATGTVLEDIRALDPAVSTIAAYGRARGLAALGAFLRLERLWLSGMSQRHLTVLPAIRTLRELVIHDYRAASFGALPELPALESLAVCGSPKLRSITGVDRYRGLKRLILFDCSNYTDLSPLAPLTSLETLCLEGGFSKLLRVENLTPLSALRSLKCLRLASIRVRDGGLAPLEGLGGLESVFIARTFPDAELSRLGRALPRVRGEFLDTFRSHGAG